MKVGLIDVDGRNKFPNIALMKISAWHKQQGDNVSWYSHFDAPYDLVYCSKVFSFTPDFNEPINATEIRRGGSGYCIDLVDGKEIYHSERDSVLPYEIEHIYPDYSLYPELTKDTAYGFLTRGCPRGCDFCIVGKKESRCSHKVADLSEFWNGQKNIVLCDPNILACKEWKSLFQQLIDSNAKIDFNQGLDIRLITEEKIEYMNQMKIHEIHFAWDKYEDKKKILPKFKLFAENFHAKKDTSSHIAVVYTLTNFDTTFEQDLDRIYTLKDMGYWAYVMIYDKKHCDPKYRKLQNWVNYRNAFMSIPRWEDVDFSTRGRRIKEDSLALF